MSDQENKMPLTAEQPSGFTRRGFLKGAGISAVASSVLPVPASRSTSVPASGAAPQVAQSERHIQ